MDEITIKITKAQAEIIAEALKYMAAHVNEYYKEQYLETHYVVKSQMQ